MFGGGFNPMMGMGGMNQGQPQQVKVSALALMKMLKHCRSGVPFEVMGVMLGEMEDEFTVTCVDVFAMPQVASTVSVESVDPVFQLNMVEMLEKVGRREKLVGWYHSHPGFGCWLSIVDITTQKSFEQQNTRAVAVVIDPIQSVKGRVVMDAFRSINPYHMMMKAEPRQTTSNEGQMKKPQRDAMMRGLNRLFYSMNIKSKTSDDIETDMLSNLNKQEWSACLKRALAFEDEEQDINQQLKELESLTKQFKSQINMDALVEKELDFIGKKQIKTHIVEKTESLSEQVVLNELSLMLNSVAF
ncbi:26s proteasome non-atpase regulatory subunit [Stylonychia lemnae]|uniref:26s proteasome non-atpase regulatory subunit n=1 Tax=Stylonychia lemnae TaxID=5949 RepID=A0A078BAF2_STYLE|nr:26s proteasome non-atpase regulatory subunit [Stylonychia lemnae]|eukprot:CDW91206.1 26s proteasome non-atpase regulatory subunit [Stylonychia lemnae]